MELIVVRVFIVDTVVVRATHPFTSISPQPPLFSDLLLSPAKHLSSITILGFSIVGVTRKITLRDQFIDHIPLQYLSTFWQTEL